LLVAVFPPSFAQKDKALLFIPVIAPNSGVEPRRLSWRVAGVVGPAIEVALGDFAIDVTAVDQRYPAVASGPPSYLVVYGKIEGTAIHIYGRLYWPDMPFTNITLYTKGECEYVRSARPTDFSW
jgi:hypothetical protein